MKIPLIVTSVHVLLVLAAIYIEPSPLKTPPHTPVTVRTLVLAESKMRAPVIQAPPAPIEIPPEAVQEEVAAAEPEAAPEPEKTPEPEPVAAEPTTHPPVKPTPKAAPTLPPRATPKAQMAPKVPPKVAEATKPKPAAKKQVAKAAPAKPKVNPNHDKLVALMQNSLTTLNTTAKSSSKSGSSSSGSATGSKAIGSLASEALRFETLYEEELVPYLQALLSFPEKGEVKVKVTLKREGTVQKVEILKASSPKNKSYIESALATCSFPPFGSRFKGEPSHTFTLNLTSTK